MHLKIREGITLGQNDCWSEHLLTCLLTCEKIIQIGDVKFLSAPSLRIQSNISWLYCISSTVAVRYDDRACQSQSYRSGADKRSAPTCTYFGWVLRLFYPNVHWLFECAYSWLSVNRARNQTDNQKRLIRNKNVVGKLSKSENCQKIIRRLRK